MKPLKIATVQFETRDNDKMYNLSSFRHNIRGLICTSIYWWNCQVKHTPSLCQEKFQTEVYTPYSKHFYMFYN